MTPTRIRPALALALGAAALLPLGCSEAEGQPAESQPAPARGALLDAPVEPVRPVTGPRYGDGIEAMADDLTQLDPDALAEIAAIDEDVPVEPDEDGVLRISWRDLSMQDLPMDDILDKLLYPEDYEEGEYDFPERIARFDGEKVAIIGYMIPLEWDEAVVPEFMLVRDLLGCCFGGSPMPDEWMEVTMVDEGAEYYPYIPIRVTGELVIEGIEDEAGYAAGCFVLKGEKVEKVR